MRFYNRPHTYYCGIDLHVKTMYVCILDGAGQVLVHRNVPSTPEAFLEIVAPYREGLVVTHTRSRDGPAPPPSLATTDARKRRRSS